MARFQKQMTGRLAEQDAVLAPVPPVAAQADELSSLVQAIRGGDADAAGTLIAHVGGPMLNVVRRVLGPASADVEDVAQEAVIALLGSVATFRGDCTVLRFGQRIALLTALAARRRAGYRHRRSEALELAVDVRDGGLSPLGTTLAARRRELVRRLLDELPEVIAEALALHFMLGYTVDEIADAAAISPHTVWSRLRLGKRALRRMLEGCQALPDLLEVGE